MTAQGNLFDISECQAEPWTIPANLKRIDFISWVKQNSVELALRWDTEMQHIPMEHYDPSESWLEWDFSRGRTRFEEDDDNLIEQWLLTEYEKALANG